MLAVLGDPVAHSVSPPMQNAAIGALGLDAVYVALRVPPDALPAVLRACAAAGVAGNLTVPHKETGARLARPASTVARALGAVNTFWPDSEDLAGDNTDVAGIEATLDELEATGPVLLCGTGGSARAVAAAVLRRRLTLVVRSRARARADAFAAWAEELVRALGWPGARVEPDDGQPVQTVVNATPRGLAVDDPPPVETSRWRTARAVLDLAYRPGETAWVRACREAGLRATDGRAVLVAQGAAAFERFFPGHRAPLDVMRAAVSRALAP